MSNPEFKFPTGAKGWLVVLAGAFVGLVAGGITLNVLGRLVA